MKIIQRISFVLLLLTGILFLNSCGDGNATTDNEGGETSNDSTEVIKVEPQNFPVNELPDSYFGKEVTEADLNAGDATENNLSLLQEGYPEWLDAIISRESIVIFASKILSEMPEEVEFVQTTQKHYMASDDWKGFKVLFTTRPSNVNIFIMGAYQTEDNPVWMSVIEKEAISVGLESIAPDGEGVMLKGKMGEKPFAASLKKESVSLDM